MELLNIYETFTKQREDYLGFIEQLVKTDFAMLSESVVKAELESNKAQFEALMTAASELEAEDAQLENLKDLRYLLMDMVFLAGDLAHFYQLNELGRFKMRALNAINKKQRAEMFQ